MSYLPLERVPLCVRQKGAFYSLNGGSKPMRQSLCLIHSEASFQANEASNFCFPKERLLICERIWLFRTETNWKEPMNLEAPSVWRIFAGNLKTITNMQKKSLASDIYQHIMAWKCTKNSRTKYGASLFFLSLHEI